MGGRLIRLFPWTVYLFIIFFFAFCIDDLDFVHADSRAVISLAHFLLPSLSRARICIVIISRTKLLHALARCKCTSVAAV